MGLSSLLSVLSFLILPSSVCVLVGTTFLRTFKVIQENVLKRSPYPHTAPLVATLSFDNGGGSIDELSLLYDACGLFGSSSLHNSEGQLDVRSLVAGLDQ
ncbi:hypothetical protein VNO77_23794 [Canavalia gladiata]|uniref:Uncharacterized protein n=1 Tax=Canavalia gladiata TaxID=3824 RepID=A0AAN9L5J7_CANGL